MDQEPTLSIVVPLYNEGGNAKRVLSELLEVFDAEGVDLELVAVNNGSNDETPSILDEMALQHERIQVVHLETNQGYGGGILSGLYRSRGGVLGYTWGDGQVSADDHVSIYRRISEEGADLAKSRRVTRHDGPARRVVTTVYNLAFRLLIQSISGDVNGCPKFFRRETFVALNITSRDWFIDPEIMIKVSERGLKMVEVPVVFHARSSGKSKVKLKTMFEFVRNMFAYRFKRGRFRS